jgi:hypothetical protein
MTAMDKSPALIMGSEIGMVDDMEMWLLLIWYSKGEGCLRVRGNFKAHLSYRQQREWY